MSNNTGVLFLLVTAVYLQTCQGGIDPAAEDPSSADAMAGDSISSAAIDDASISTKAIDLDQWHDLESIIPKLAQQRVVFVGEEHTRLDHHLNQLAIIRHLYEAHPDLAIGVEYFQQPYQHDLDEFIEGKIDATELLLRTQYYRRWGYDFRLYAPIFQFAQAHSIPVIALNVPKEITDQVALVGFDGLDPQQRAALPKQIDQSNLVYRKQLALIYQQHPTVEGGNFEKFYDVQLAWDEGMAARAAQYLQQHPDRPMVILAGQGHLAYGFGIPDRLVRRVAVPAAIVLNDWQGVVSPNLADFMLASRERKLPPPAVLGVILAGEEEETTGALIKSFVHDSAAQAAGIEQGDRIIALDKNPVDSIADVKAMLWNKKPGDQVWVKVRRERLFQGDEELSFAVTLRSSQ